jgi:large subunit ribosomal protein L4
MKVSLYNQNAETVGEIELNSKVFEVKPNKHLLAEAVRVYLSNARQGTSNTKTRGEVSGGGKKPWKQKGTGRARAGSTRSPIWRHGGVTFGPRANRNWTLKLNKKSARQALFMGLSDKAADNKLFVIDGIKLENAKTKEFVKVITGFKKQMDLGKKQLFVIPNDKNLVRASRNVSAVTPIMANSLNLHEVLRADSMIVLKDALATIEKTYLKK